MTGKPTKETTGIIQRLAILNMSRGEDSSGMAFISREEGIVRKQAVASDVFLADTHVQKLLNESRKKDYITILGHTRFATHGAIITDNAHPFINDKYIFTHNGVINNYDELNKKYGSAYEVDSQIIGEVLANMQTYRESFNALAGYFTVPYVSMYEPDILQVAVHNNVFAFAYRGQQLYYSSEMGHLKQALKGLRGFQFCKTGDDVLYSFYPVGQGIAIGKEKIQPQSSWVSYAYDNRYEKWQSPGWVTDEYEEEIVDYNHNKKLLEEQEAKEELDKLREYELWMLDQDKKRKKETNTEEPVRLSTKKLLYQKYKNNRKVYKAMRSANPNVAFD